MADFDAEYGKLYCRLLICLPNATARCCFGFALLSVIDGDPLADDVNVELLRIPLHVAVVVCPQLPLA